VVLIGGVIGVVVAAVVVVAVVVRLRSRDDVHSVEHYHRQLHTLEEMRTQPPQGREDGNGEAAFPARAFRVSSSSAVRLTEPGHTLVPPVPPLVPNPSEPLRFDDEDASEDVHGDAPEAIPATFMTGSRDKAMTGINHRPRRLGGPALAVAAVAALIVVLVVAGLHANPSSHHGKSAASATTTHATTHATTRHPTDRSWRARTPPPTR
jgi:hypothetical protein